MRSTHSQIKEIWWLYSLRGRDWYYQMISSVRMMSMYYQIIMFRSLLTITLYLFQSHPLRCDVPRESPNLVHDYS